MCSPDKNDLGLESVAHTFISGAICEVPKILDQKIEASFLARHLSGWISFFLIISMCNYCRRVMPAEER